MDPTHQPDKSAKLIRTRNANTTLRIEDHSILWYLQPVQVLCLTINQSRPDGIFLRWPRPALTFDMCSCQCIIALHPPALLLHRPTSSRHTWPARSEVLLYFSPCNFVFFSGPHASVCAHAPPSRPTRLQCAMYFTTCLTAQHGSRSARTAETQHLICMHHRPG